MNKRIIISLSIIVAVGAIVIGVTTSYFSNTETSSGNTFIAGAIDLKIDNTCHHNGRVCAWYKNNNGFPPGYYWDGIPANGSCDCTWALMDLDGKAIFNFTDVKPGDNGEDTISLHVDSNPAWVCAEISNVAQYDNGCNSPELKAEEVAYGVGLGTCGNLGLGEGELWDNLTFSIWMDNGAGANSCNNIKDTDETYLIENAKAANLTWPIADSQTGSGPIQDACIGVAWSVPDAVENIIQGDSVTGDITFNAYQARNNNSFLCNPPPPPRCGNGNIDSGETCELPNTIDNLFCTQSTSQCDGTKTQTRDGLGNCDDVCGCVLDPFSAPVCVKDSCGATCAVDADCDDSNPATTDTCLGDCTCTHTSGTITVHKVVENNGVGTKTPGEFQMTIDSGNVAQDIALPYPIGNHTVSETDAQGYITTFSAECPAGVVSVVANTNVTCTVTNTMPYFTVTVNKVLVNDNNGNAVIGDFDLFVGAYGVTSGVSKKVAVGTYLISESGVIGYNAIFSGDCDPNTQLLAGVKDDVKTCTITNDDIAPVITLIKSVVGGSALPTDFIMRIDGGAGVPSGGSKSVTSNTAHSINEDAKAGYHFTSMSGIGSQGSLCPTSLGGTVTLNEGEVITCTITNTSDTP